MGLMNNSPVSLMLLLCIILMFFGPGKIKHLGADLGEALKQFRRAMKDDHQDDPDEPQTPAGS